MPVLIGAFGNLSQCPAMRNTIKKTSVNIVNCQQLINDNCFIFAGYNNDSSKYSDNIYLLNIDCGIVVIGKVFERATYKPAHFTPTDARILVKNPDLLLENYWGRYIALLYDKANGKITLVRDPQGLSTLFYSISKEGILFSTALSALYDIVPEKPSLDFSYFAEYIANKNHVLASTPFESIKELLPGKSLSVDKFLNTKEKFLWNVARINYSYIEDEQAFEEEILSVIRSCTKAWLKDANGICLELSGGLDSSAMAIMVRDIFPDALPIVAVNYIDSLSPSSNETEYAQETARVCQIPLHFINWQDSSILDEIPSSLRPNKPSTSLLFYKLNELLDAIAEEYGCNQIINGQGGDHVFMAPPFKNSLADYWLEKGIRGITHYLHPLSAYYRIPWLELAKDNVKAILEYYRKPKHQNPDMKFLDQRFSASLKTSPFFLAQNLSQFYPAKGKHIESLYHALLYADRDQRLVGKIITHPLLSQPVVELGMRVPTYQAYKNGFDRYLFRRAISRLQNPKTLWRTFKGQTTTTITDALAQNITKIEVMITHGSLVKNNIIDKKWLNNELLNIKHGNIENMWLILHTLTSQIWLNLWGL